MSLKKKFLMVLKEKTGASMIFVLGIMLFLMAIGVSTMAAAGANAGFILRQSEYSRIRIVDESIHENIMFSLQYVPDDDDDRSDFLGYQIAMAIYDAYDAYHDYYKNPAPLPPAPDDGLAPIILTVSVDGNSIDPPGGLITVERIELSFPFRFSESDSLITINPAVPAVTIYDPVTDADIEDSPRQPKTVTMSAIMEVRVDIAVRGLGGNVQPRTVTSIAVYEYTGAKLTEIGITGDMEFEVVGFGADAFGTWELIRYEVIDR